LGLIYGTRQQHGGKGFGLSVKKPWRFVGFSDGKNGETCVGSTVDLLAEPLSTIGYVLKRISAVKNIS
jgi:hypothetical protein